MTHWNLQNTKKRLRILSIGILVVSLLLTLLIPAVDHNFLGLFGGSPTIEQLENPIQMESSEIYSDDQVLIGKFYTENRSLITYEELSPIIIQTLVQTEDKRFYQHHGVDYYGLFTAMKDALLGDARGASTLSQQLVKNLFKMRYEYNDGALCHVPVLKTFIVKIKECLGAHRIEKKYTKEEILTLYLNTVYFGNHAYGIKMAAKRYFNMEPKELTYEQVATIIGILKATTYYNPIRNPENNLFRRNVILRNLQDQDILTHEVCDSLIALPLNLNVQAGNDERGQALYFREAVFNEAQEWCEKNGYDLYRDGLKIYTSIDSRLQAYAEKAVTQEMGTIQKRFNEHWKGQNPWRDQNQKELSTFIDETIKKTSCYKNWMNLYHNEDSVRKKIREPHSMKIFTYKGLKDTVMSSIDSLKYTLRFLHTGFIAMDPQTGKVKAWVGDVDFNYWQYDKVTAKRQPGSTFKLFVYATALKNGRCSCDQLVDSAVTWPIQEENELKIWKPQNASGSFSGESVTLKTALARSINSIPVQLTQQMTPDSVVQMAHAMGITSPIRPIPSIALGAEDVSLLEMASAYSSVVDNGRLHKPILITRIEDRNGHILYKNNPETTEALDYETAFLLRDMLQEGLRDEQGTSQRLHDYKILAETDFGGKTGTTSNYSDAWYMGITPKLVAGAWVGGEYRCIHFRNGTYGQGSRTALPIFGRFMEYVLNDPQLKKIYRGRFDVADSEKIQKKYDCETMEENEQPVKNFFRRIFGKETDESVRDSIKQQKKKERQERKEKRREKRRNR